MVVELLTVTNVEILAVEVVVQLNISLLVHVEAVETGNIGNGYGGGGGGGKTLDAYKLWYSRWWS